MRWRLTTDRAPTSRSRMLSCSPVPGDAAGPLAEALERYERLRRGRTRKVQYASLSVPDVLHLPDGETPTGATPGSDRTKVCCITSTGSTGSTRAPEARRTAGRHLAVTAV